MLSPFVNWNKGDIVKRGIELECHLSELGVAITGGNFIVANAQPAWTDWKPFGRQAFPIR